VGTFSYEITTALGDPGMVMICVLVTAVTHEAGTTTGLFQLLGTTIEFGTLTNELAGTTTMLELGTGAMTILGTKVGTF